MEIKNVEIKPMYDVDIPHHLKPTLRVCVEILYTYSQEMVLDIYGNLCINGTILSPIKIDNYGENGEEKLVPAFPSEVKTDINDTLIRLKGYAELDKESIDFIEKSRSVDKNKNVNFSVSLTVSYLENRALTSYVVGYKLDENDNKSIFKKYKQDIIQNIKSQYMSTPYEIQETDISFLLYTRPINGKDYRSKRDNLHLISGNYDKGKGEYIAHNRITRSFPCTIKLSDWVNDYAPKLGIGEFLILEVPIKFPDSNNKLEDNAETELKNALTLMSNAEKAFYNMDPPSVISNCRQAVEGLSIFMVNKKFKNKDQLTDWQNDAMEKIIRLSGKYLGNLKSFNKKYNDKQQKENLNGMEGKDKQDKDIDSKDNNSKIKSGWVGIFGFLSFMSHDQTQNDGTVHSLILPDRYDAEAALFFTKVFLKFVAELMYNEDKKDKQH